MTKKIAVLLLCTLLLLFSGCQNFIEPSSESSNPNTTNLPDNSRIPDNYSPYQIYSDQETLFTKEVVRNNPIDAQYELVFSTEPGTVQEFVEVQRKYAEIWEQEMEYAASRFETVLTEEDRAQFRDSQDNWVQGMTDTLEFESQFALGMGGDHRLGLGTNARWLIINEQRETFRARAIRIKYLHYLFEESQFGNTQNYHPNVEDYQSLQFLFDGNA